MSCARSLPYLVTRWVPGGTILASVSAVLLVLLGVSMYLTATGDPGILPRSPEVPDEIMRNPAHPRERIVYVGETPITTKYCGMSGVLNSQRYRTLLRMWGAWWSCMFLRRLWTFCRSLLTNILHSSLVHPLSSLSPSPLLPVPGAETCRIWRPPRASHCATCNNCVDRFEYVVSALNACRAGGTIFHLNYRSVSACLCLASRLTLSVVELPFLFLDSVCFVGPSLRSHHCPYLGTCIGRRSYRSFYLFVVSGALASIVVITACVIHLVTKTVDFRNATMPPTSVTSALKSTLTDGATAVQLAIIPFCFLALLFTGGLTVFHLWLMWRNVTTAESFKRTWTATGNPFPDRGLWSMWALLCTSKPPSKIKETYDETAAAAARDAADAVTAATAASVAAAAAAVAAGDLRGEE